MRLRMISFVRLLTAVFSLVLVLVSAGQAAEEKAKPKTKKVQGVTEWAFKHLNASHEAIAAGNYGEALAELEEMKGSSRLNDHEEALIWQTYGFIYGSQEKYPQAMAAFEKCLAKQALPDAAQLNVQFNLAQLYVMQEQYKKALTLFADWFAKTPEPSPESHYVYGIALLQSGDKKNALVHGLLAIQNAKVPKEAWLQLVLSVYLETKQYKASLAPLETLVALYPRKAYWMQLSAIYAEQDEFEKALASMALAYEQKLLTEGREINQLAQLYLYNRVPYRAAVILEKGMAQGKIDGSGKNWQLLGEAWLAAREREKAGKPLSMAAARSDDGELFYRLAQIQIDSEEWEAAQKSLAQAIKKGGLDDPAGAQLLLGIASASALNWKDAKTAFEAAKVHKKTAAAAKEWLLLVEVELRALEPEPADAEVPAGEAAASGADSTEPAVAAPTPLPAGEPAATAAPTAAPPA